MSAPKLDKPGAGLPLIETLVGRYWIFPRYLKGKNWKDHFSVFLAETEKIVRLTEQMDNAVFATPVLIDRLKGLEDSSRFWSPAMVMEHLIVVNDGIVRIASSLAKGQVPQVRVDTARVKPDNKFASLGREAVVSVFGKKAREAVDYLAPLEEGANVTARLPHPWFGPMNASAWVGLMAMHQDLHRRQMRAITDKPSAA